MSKLQTLFPLKFSSSMLEDIFGCKQLFFRKNCQKLIGNGVNIHLYAGSLLATGLEKTRKAYFNDGLTSEDSIDLGYYYILESPDTNDELKSNERLAQAFKRYFKVFPLENSLKPVQLIDGSYGIEYKFELDLGIPHPEISNRNIIFTGKLDFLGETFNAQGEREIVVEDDKSTKNVRRVKGTKIVDIAAEKEQYLMRGQFVGYHWAAREILKPLGLTTKNTVVRRLPILKEPENPFELPIPITKHQIDNWLQSVQGQIYELVERYKCYKGNISNNSFSYFPIDASGEQCYNYARLCTFHSACKYKEGEEILEMTMRQGVRYPEWQGEDEISLIDYKKHLNLEI